MLSAAELHRRGLTASGAGRFGEARRLLTTARDRAESEDLTAEIEVSLAYVNAETGHGDEGLRLCEQALARPGISGRTRGIARSQLGLLLMRRGAATQALAEFSAAVAALRDEPEYAARAHLNRGNVYLQLGDAAKAQRDFAASLEYAGDSPGAAAKARHNLGYTHLLRGDLVAALRLMEQAFPELARLSPVYHAVVSQDRAEAMIAAGLVHEGESLLREAVRACSSRRLRQFQGEAELALARAVLEVDPRGARVAAARASRRFAARGARSWALRADAVVLMAAVAAGGTTGDLIAEADRLLPELRQEGLQVDATLVALQAARVLVQRGELSEARRRLRRIRLGETAPLAGRLMYHEIRGDVARAGGRRAESFRHIRAGLAELQAWQASFGSLDLQSGVVGHGRRLAIDGLRLAVADGRPEVLFEWSERGRMLVSRVVPLRAPADEEVALELAELRWLQSQAPDPRSREGRRMAALQETIRQHAWYGGGSGEVSEPCTLAECQVGLGARTALVAYVATDERIVALVVTDATATVHDLGERTRLDALLGGLHPDLDMAGSDLPAAFAAPVRRELAVRLGRLAELLVEPLLGDLGDRRLVLTPSGVLAGVPWGLLPGMQSRPVTVTRSATSWLGRQATPLRVRTAGFVAGPRVARANAEVIAAAETWDAPEILTGEHSTAAAVSDLAARVDVLHLSAHGRHSAENPLFSGLELVDGPWFGYDIDQLAEIPDVVLLSACEVGRSQVRSGEELIGMTTAWLHAGARCVIASSAAVNDEMAHDVLVAVHRGLGTGADPAAALAAALPAAGEDAPPAPFVCFC